MTDWASISVLAVAGLIVLRGAVRGVDVYGAVISGGSAGAKTASGLLPALCAMTALLAMMEASGLNAALSRLLSPFLTLMNLPEEIAPMLILRPITGSGSLTTLQQIFDRCGVDSRAGRIASVLMGSSETIFYTLTVYLGATDIRRLPWVIPVSVISYLAGAIVCGVMV